MTKTPVDSAKKKSGKRLVAGGVAERLQKLIQREKSEITFWQHKMKTMKPVVGCTGELGILPPCMHMLYCPKPTLIFGSE